MARYRIFDRNTSQTPLHSAAKSMLKRKLEADRENVGNNQEVLHFRRKKLFVKELFPLSIPL